MPLFCHVVIVITAEYRDYGDHCSVGEYSGRHMAVILMDHTALLDEDNPTSVSTTDSSALFPGSFRSTSEVPSSPPSPSRGSVESQRSGGCRGQGGGDRSHRQGVGGLLVVVPGGRHHYRVGQGGSLGDRLVPTGVSTAIKTAESVVRTVSVPLTRGPTGGDGSGTLGL